MKGTLALFSVLSLTVASPAFAAPFFSKNGWVAAATTKNGQSGVMCQNLQASGKAKNPVFIPGGTESWANSLDANTFQLPMKTKKGVPVILTIYPSCDGTWWNKQIKNTNKGYKASQKSLNLPISLSVNQVTEFLNRQGVR